MSLEFSNATTPTARKTYECDLCCSSIHEGEKYSRFCGKYDGEMFDIKHHLLCAEIIGQYCNYIGDDEYDEDNVREWVQETVCVGCEHYEEDREDFTPCTCSTFQCPKVIQRFSKEAR